MKISVIQENLNKSLNIISKAVSTKSNLEILGYILLKAEKGRLKLSATNLEIGISSFVGGKIDKEGEIAVPARIFIDFISSLPNKKIDIEVNNNSVKCKSEYYESEIKGLSSEEFPLIPKIEKKTGFKINAKELKEAISVVVFAAATDESRPILSGIYFAIKDGNLVMAATDSYRLAEKKIKVKEKNENVEVIIPARSLMELGRVIDDGEVEIILDENQILFTTENIEFTTRLIEGNFPDYEKIIPEVNETKVKIGKDEFLQAIKVASLFSRETTNSVAFNVRSKGEIEISSPETQSGSSVINVNAEVDGKGGEIVFNGKYLVDMLGNLKENSVLFEMSDRVSASTLKSEKDKDYVYVVMPLRS